MKASLLVPALIVLSACSSREEEVTRSESALEGGLFDDAPTANRFTVTVYGSGTVPIGAACVVGDESYTLDLAHLNVVATRCSGTPLRAVNSSAPITEAQRDAFMNEVRAVHTIASEPCVTPASNYVEVIASEDFSAFHFWSSDCSASSVPHVDGMDRLVASARAIGANAAGVVPTHFPVVAVGTSTWSDDVSYVFLDLPGHGDVPIGSICAPGAERWTLMRGQSGSDVQWMIRHGTCLIEDGVLRLSWKSHAFEAGEMSNVFDAFTRATRVESASCDVTAPYSAMTIGRNTGTSVLLTKYAPPSSICSDYDAPLQPISGLPEILVALNALRLDP